VYESGVLHRTASGPARWADACVGPRSV